MSKATFCSIPSSDTRYAEGAQPALLVYGLGSLLHRRWNAPMPDERPSVAATRELMRRASVASLGAGNPLLCTASTGFGGTSLSLGERPKKGGNHSRLLKAGQSVATFLTDTIGSVDAWKKSIATVATQTSRRWHHVRDAEDGLRVGEADPGTILSLNGVDIGHNNAERNKTVMMQFESFRREAIAAEVEATAQADNTPMPLELFLGGVTMDAQQRKWVHANLHPRTGDVTSTAKTKFFELLVRKGWSAEEMQLALDKIWQPVLSKRNYGREGLLARGLPCHLEDAMCDVFWAHGAPSKAKISSRPGPPPRGGQRRIISDSVAGVFAAMATSMSMDIEGHTAASRPVLETMFRRLFKWRKAGKVHPAFPWCGDMKSLSLSYAEAGTTKAGGKAAASTKSSTKKKKSKKGDPEGKAKKSKKQQRRSATPKRKAAGEPAPPLNPTAHVAPPLVVTPDQGAPAPEKKHKAATNEDSDIALLELQFKAAQARAAALEAEFALARARHGRKD